MSNPNYARVDERMLQRRVQNMIARGVVTNVDDALKMQALGVDLEDGFKATKVEHWHPYGLTYHPHAGAEVLAFALGGNRDHMVILPGADRRYRLQNLAAGELAVHDDQGQRVHFKRDGVHVQTSKKVVAIAPQVLVGEDNPGLPRVMTEAGPSSVLRAKV